MSRLWWALNLVIAMLFISLSFHDTAYASDVVDWSIGIPETVKKQKITYDNFGKDFCDGVISRYLVYKDGEHDVCLTGSRSIKFGYYGDEHGYRTVIGLGYERKLYKLETDLCSDPEACLYADESDKLFVINPIEGVTKRALTVYEHFSQRLKFNYDPGFSVILEVDKPDNVVNGPGDYPWTVGHMNMSANGRYILIESPDRGFLIVDTNNLSTKAIYYRGFTYNVGRNPYTEMSITNDGNTVAIMGLNAGFNLITGINHCGITDYYSELHLLWSYQYTNCQMVNLSRVDLGSRFQYAYHPFFSENGGSLDFKVNDYENDWDVQIVAGSYHPQSLSFLTLGDSYTSGEGDVADKYYQTNTNTLDETCHVSVRSYGYLMDSLFNLNNNSKVVACSGATTKDILGYVDYSGQGGRLNKINNGSASDLLRSEALTNWIPGRIPQIEFIDQAESKVIMVGIGGNDVDLVGKLIDALKPGDSSWATEITWKNRSAKEILNLQSRLERVYREIIKRSPTSYIYGIGYPQIITSSGKCDKIHAKMFTQAERDYMRAVITLINQVVRSAAANVGVGYIDIENVLGNNIICGDEPNYINSIRLGDDNFIFGNESYHPSPDAHRLYAEYIAKNYPNILYQSHCGNTEYICPQEITKPKISEYWNLDNDDSAYQQSVKMLDEDSDTSPTKKIHLPNYSFTPLSTVTVEIYSDKVDLGTFLTDENGALSIDVSVPESIDTGSHTVFVRGTDFGGEKVYYYQSINIIKPQPEVYDSPKDDLATNIIVTSDQIAAIPVPLNRPTTNLPIVEPASDAPAVLGASDSKSIQSYAPTLSKISKKDTSRTYWIIWGVASVFICSGLAVYIKRSRNK